jgi:hypothetical protein
MLVNVQSKNMIEKNKSKTIFELILTGFYSCLFLPNK